MSILLYELVGADPARPFSPHCWKVAFALAHKGLAFETVPIGFTQIPSVEGGVSKIVPVIRDGEGVIADSFAIALYLEERYADRPSLFAGEGGRAMARFVESWTQATVHPYIGAAALMDIHDCLGPEDRAYFRRSREARYGRRLEEIPGEREEKRAAFRASLAPLRSMLKSRPFIGGDEPLFADHIVAGAFQWARIVSPFQVLEPDDPVTAWVERCLDLYGGLARRVPAAA